jgi:aspartyl protease family protein
MWPTGPKPGATQHSGPARSVASQPEAEAGSAEDTLLTRRSDGHFYVDAEVDGQLVNFVIDTGASRVVLPVETARRLNIPFSESDFDVIGSGASGPVRGMMIEFDRISIEGKEVRNVKGAIAEGLDQPLLGQSYLSRIASVEMSGESMRLQ